MRSIRDNGTGQSRFHPPRSGQWLLRRLSDYQDQYSIAGDVEEVYRKIRAKSGWLIARTWHIYQCLIALIRYGSYKLHWSLAMFKNYIKTAFRHIRNQKGYTFINIAGLTAGLTVCIIILLWVRDELSFDRFHKNADRIYRLTEDQVSPSGDVFKVAVSPWPAGPAFKEEFPQVEDVTRLRNFSNMLMRYGEKSFWESGVCAVDHSFLRIFDFPLIKGDRESALSRPNTALITPDLAEKYFGNENPIGKTLRFVNAMTDFEVTGIIEPPPSNSHIVFRCLIPIDPTIPNWGWTINWTNNSYYNYILLRSATDAPALSEKIYSYVLKFSPTTSIRFKLQRLADIHLHSAYAIDLYGATSDQSSYIYIFSIIAILILLIACINFVNLSTARSEKRAREVGMRKVVGARKKDIIAQFYGESVLIVFFAMALSLALISLLLPFFNQISGKKIESSALFSLPALLILFASTFIAALLAGTYPALFLSSFQPARAMKGGSDVSSLRSGILRKSLVIIQFIISIAVIAGTLAVAEQIRYMRNKDLGYNKDSIIYFRIRGELGPKFDTFKNELLQNPNILHVTTASDVPTYTVNSSWGADWEGKTDQDNFLVHHFSVNQDYIQTLGLELKEGRDFFPGGEFEKGNEFILNEAAVKAIGMENPVGKRFALWGNWGTIVGVVQDFHFKSLHQAIEPLILYLQPMRTFTAFVRLGGQKTQNTLKMIEVVHNRLNPEYPFTYDFLDQSLDALYSGDRRTETLLGVFTFLSILLSCMGLMGLTSYIAQKRTKEIGIRKVLGASSRGILILLNREFLGWVLIANAIALPVIYFIIRMWLESFAYRMNLGLSIFILSFGISILVALFTVSVQTIRAATANPVKSIQYE